MCLMISVTDWVCSYHLLPYHVSVRSASVLVYGSFDQTCLKEQISLLLILTLGFNVDLIWGY